MRFHRCNNTWLRSQMGAFAFLVASAVAHGAPASPPPLSRDDAAERAGPTDLLRFTANATHYYFGDLGDTDQVLLFLPPPIPKLYAPPLLRSPLDTGIPPPAELNAHVADIFYPLLAARLATADLPRHIRLELDTYRSSKAALLNELQDLLAHHRESTLAARSAALSECAHAQATRLQGLEAEAERIRSALAACTPSMHFEVHDKAGVPPAAGVALMRSAAFFLDGLSGAQRRLLRTVADELEKRPEPAAPTGSFFFTPEGASLQLPTGLEPGTRSEIEAYIVARRALASTLLQAILNPDFTVSKLQELAAAQAPALDALDARAEAIRSALQSLPDAAGLATNIPLPAELTERFAAYRERKTELYRELHASISLPAASVAGRTGEVAVPAAAFTPEQQDKLAALNAEKNALRAALAELRRNSGAASDRKTVDTLLEDFERARQAQEIHEKYRDYRIVLLEPGLSPAQRRLLFGAALQALALPLPFGEPIRQP